jgi:hypothetical protein
LEDLQNAETYYGSSGYWHEFQNAWHEYIGEDQVRIAFWTDKEYKERLMLLELREEFSVLGEEMIPHIDQIRYNCPGINATYYGGDTRSWQRYTHKQPLPGSIAVDEEEQRAVFAPGTALKASTWYCIALLHTNHSYTPYFYEDYLIPFKTAADTNKK